MFWPRLWHNVMAIAPTFPNWNEHRESTQESFIVSWLCLKAITSLLVHWNKHNHFRFSSPQWYPRPLLSSTLLLCRLSHCGYCEMFALWGAQEICHHLKIKPQLASKNPTRFNSQVVQFIFCSPLTRRAGRRHSSLWCCPFCISWSSAALSMDLPWRASYF